MIKLFEILSHSEIAAIAAVVLVVVQKCLEYFVNKRDKLEVKEDVDNTVKLIKAAKEQDDDVFSLMIKNVAELREYYVINKQQARRSFNAALLICILGFIVFISGIYINYEQKAEVVKLTTIAGSIVEIIAGLFFWLYKKALDQINIFHVSLLKTEKFLTAIQLVEKISEDKRDENYANIINNIMRADVIETNPSEKVSKSKKVKVKPE